MFVKDVSSETPVRTEHLPCHRPPHRIVLFRHESNLFPMRIQYDIFIRLLKADQDVHKLQLPLYDDARVRQDVGCWMLCIEHVIGVFGDMDGR